VAGYLFDLTREYSTAVLIAAGANVADMAMALSMPMRGWRERGLTALRRAGYSAAAETSATGLVVLGINECMRCSPAT
jgi:hypothetical protein